MQKLLQKKYSKNPWDTIDWELCLRAVTSFRARLAMPADKVSARSRGRKTFPRGTCWAFQGGRFCGGCRFPHLCFKCGSPHPASQCAQSASPRPTLVQPGNKQSPSAHPPAHQSGNPRKGWTGLIFSYMVTTTITNAF